MKGEDAIFSVNSGRNNFDRLGNNAKEKEKRNCFLKGGSRCLPAIAGKSKKKLTAVRYFATATAFVVAI